MHWKLLFFTAWLVTQLHAADQQSKSGIFEMRMVYDEPTPNSTVLDLTKKTSTGESSVQKLIVGNRPLLDVTSVRSAKPRRDPATKGAQISIEFTESGKKQFSKVTRESVGRRLAIVIEGKLIMAPRINEEISGGMAMIAGDFTREQAKEIAEKINKAANTK
jgi:preprotein translocase subunit SecD